MKKLILLVLLLDMSLKADIKRGKAVYKNNCVMCHTTNGGSALGPDFNMVSYTRMTEEIKNTMQKIQMPSMKLLDIVQMQCRLSH